MKKLNFLTVAAMMMLPLASLANDGEEASDFLFSGCKKIPIGGKYPEYMSASAPENAGTIKRTISTQAKDFNYNEIYDPEEGTGYEFDYSGENLTVIIHNYAAPCAMDFVGLSLTEIGSHHYLLDTVIGSDIMATCMCYYDFKGTFSDIEAGRYLISFRSAEGLTFEVNLKGDTKTVKYYKDHTTGTDVVSSEDSVLEYYGNGILKVNSEGAFALSIYDLSGQQYAAINGEESAEVSLENLPSGVYILRCDTPAGSTTLRLYR